MQAFEFSNSVHEMTRVALAFDHPGMISFDYFVQSIDYMVIVTHDVKQRDGSRNAGFSDIQLEINVILDLQEHHMVTCNFSTSPPPTTRLTHFSIRHGMTPATRIWRPCRPTRGRRSARFREMYR